MVSDKVRRAVVEIHSEASLQAPDHWKQFLEDAGWRSALKDAGWEVELENGKILEVKEWTPRELNGFFNDQQRSHQSCIETVGTGFDSRRVEPWRYHLAVVEHIKGGGLSRPLGLMPDIGDLGQDDLPRQGAAIAAKRPVEGGRTLEEMPDLFCRTALHELGHMQGLYHNPSERGIMQPREHLSQVMDKTIDMRHSSVDARRLRHLPDMWVRPGGVQFLHRYRASAVDILDLFPETKGLGLKVDDLVIQVGAETKEIRATLINKMGKGIRCPDKDQVAPEIGCFSLSLRTSTGRMDEILPVRFPRELSENNTDELGANTDELDADNRAKSYWIPCHTKVYQAGLHSAQVHLMWRYKYSDTTQRGMEVYRASGTGWIEAIDRNRSDIQNDRSNDSAEAQKEIP